MGKLRAHFGDLAGALQAVKQGLALVPGDYEFLTLEQEIHAGATLEQMLCHWINPEADSLLQAGNDADAEEKQNAIACVTVNEAGLAAFYRMFRPEQYGYIRNDPDCQFPYPVGERQVVVSFRMNEAGLSKLSADWLQWFKDRLDSGDWLTHTPEEGPQGVLEAVFVAQSCRMGFVYRQAEENGYFQIFRDRDGSECSEARFAGCRQEPED